MMVPGIIKILFEYVSSKDIMFKLPLDNMNELDEYDINDPLNEYGFNKRNDKLLQNNLLPGEEVLGLLSSSNALDNNQKIFFHIS